ncbi:aldehyde dehydrogenase family 2 member C4 [Selaginella moellendorffii]|uniref:aldehyde dehydrogenase family 2 member C4 n=1 Tax=Selaginella moellendorffii TaxID=88036 RepID=UPI000D1C47D1|nr:aldehyde dehydrogenase family 2 member C4 [Selaginella moellendorffii]|eukprot:XP_024538501.1 aldehyde dehydrogenase family 2 member C4 [Selaginella moellendorffii]
MTSLSRGLSSWQSGKKEGASLLVGGKRIGEKGFYIQPTIFGDVKQSMKIANEEIFGPVVSVLKFKTLDEAVELANSTHYGLAAAVFSKNIDTVNLLTRSIKSGVVYVNSYLGDGPAVPFGGYKMSGIGRENGYKGLLPYL